MCTLTQMSISTVQIREHHGESSKPVKCGWCKDMLFYEADMIYHVVFDNDHNEDLCCSVCLTDNWSEPCSWCNENSEWLTCHQLETLCPVKYQLK